MIKVENIEVLNFEGALRGMRNPLMSNNKSDSCECDEEQCVNCIYGQDEEDDCVAPDGFDYKYSIGKADMELCKKKDIWYSIIQMLPSSFNQTRTVAMNYENALNIIHWRAAHKLEEWRTFCNILINELPYMKEFISDD